MLRTSKQKRKSGNPRRTICARSIDTELTQLVTKCLFCLATSLLDRRIIVWTSISFGLVTQKKIPFGLGRNHISFCFWPKFEWTLEKMDRIVIFTE